MILVEKERKKEGDGGREKYKKEVENLERIENQGMEEELKPGRKKSVLRGIAGLKIEVE